MKEQAFVTRYSFNPPEGEEVVTVEEDIYAIDDGERIIIGSADYRFNVRTETLIKKLGGTTERTRTERRERRAPPGWVGEVAALEKALDDRCRKLGGHAYVSHGSVSITTPTRLGKAEHEARRAYVEPWLRRHGVEWSMSCATEHSDVVCRPLNLAPAQEA